MVTALYRRYRPENFAELIGQSQVTDPLRTALRTNRVNHAYLFSGPRGCGKTTSARILARCLNCAEGPTDTPCGVCPSCVELARGGSGSLDVIEIDAASHNGVDDARDLRDRAVFAPARDRYKIFILDEAHMVTPQGFNALLKLVEEPPEHVKFIFATTEPEKVIGTIRSRTHHYPFRLVPPAAMLEYVEQLCTQESVTVAPGVLPLVVRAGGGSVRDTLSLLDQLIAGSEDGALRYERAVALLGYTDSALLDDVVDALAVADPGSAFAAVDRVVQTGQDPRRFVEDLLERLRDLIVVAATNESAGAVLRGVSPEELDTMSRQAGVFGATGLSRGADIANRALTDMTGATSPRLHLELMVARMLVPEADDSQRGALARVERLERRVGVGDAGGHSGGPAVLESAPSAGSSAAAPVRDAAPSVSSATVPASSSMQPVRQSEPVSTSASSAPGTIGAAGSSSVPSSAVPSSAVSPSAGDAPQGAPAAASAAQDAAASWAAVAPGSADSSRSSGSSSTPGTDASPTAESTDRQGAAASAPSEHASSSSTGQGTVIGSEPAVRPIAPVGLQQMRDSWTQVLEHVQHAKRSAWTVVVTAQVTALRDDVLTLTFPSQQDVASFKEMADPATSVSELVRAAILDVLGFRVKFVARGPGGAGGPGQQRPAEPPRDQPAAAQRPTSAQPAPAPVPAPTTPSAQAPAQPASAQPASAQPTSAQQAQASPAAAAPVASSRQESPRSAPEQQEQQPESAPPEPQQQESVPAVQQAPVSNDPVTEWAVATIPSTDPSTGAVPEDVEPAWGAPFGSTGPSDTVAPTTTTTTAPVAAASSRAGSPDAAPSSSASGDRDGQRASATAPGAAAPRSDVPVDDYPMDDAPFDDGPYDDGAPFPDPGFGGRAAGPAPTQQAPTQQAPAAAQPAPTQQAPQQAAPAQQRPARQAPAQQPRRAPVPGRYGEAVVREILGAQFIEETTLSEGN
ncbi:MULTISPECIES: DNA polymerase III subunit gamma and tau [unclassified Curtobacterium]|uniref:DNA polymerase III subunit gamma and tau n=1 Tax=unclassified Curtobacterium TaxID=257496 RepID=UPI00226BA728|nr:MULTISPECIES: DNA polymerase III subunit gamma and tau [unclassified Curtobacterium]